MVQITLILEFDQVETAHEHEMRANIFEATNDLLRAYSYSELKVKDICRVAEVSAPTFYRFFSDKYAIVEWVLTSYMRPAMLPMLKIASLADNYRETLTQTRKYRDFYRRAYALPNAETLLRLNEQMIVEKFEEHFYQGNGIDRTERLDFQIRYTARIIPALTSRWLAEEFPLSNNEFIGLLIDATPRELRTLFDSLARRNKTGGSPLSYIGSA